MSQGINITGVLDQLDKKAEGDKVTLGAMMESIGSRGFGPLILAAALIELMPTGGIPGIPTMVALFVITFASQMVAGRQQPWIPARLRDKGFSKTKFNKARDKIKPATRKIDKLLKPRLQVFVTPFAAKVVGVICILLALTMPPLEVIPWLSYIPASAIALLAVGLSAQDGLVVLLGSLVALAGVVAGITWLFF